MAKLNYKHQLKRLKEILTDYQVDKIVMNPLSDYERGRHDVEKSLPNEFLILIKRALKGKL